MTSSQNTSGQNTSGQNTSGQNTSGQNTSSQGTFRLGPIGQIALPVSDADRAEAFYERVLGLRKLYRYGDLVFFDCAGVRLLLDPVPAGHAAAAGGCVYFRCADIAIAVAALTERGVAFNGAPHLIARMDDHDLWMAFFADPDGNTLALMQEAPKGYTPPD